MVSKWRKFKVEPDPEKVARQKLRILPPETRAQLEAGELCHADRDGDCYHHGDVCPQIRDGEPAKSSRHCPLDNWPDPE